MALTIAAALLVLALGCAGVMLAAAAHFGTMSKGFRCEGWWMGPVRLAFPFVVGLWLHRMIKRLPARRLGLIPLGLALTAIFALPVIGGAGTISNGVAKALAVIVLFPAVILLGVHSGRRVSTVCGCNVLGRLSYGRTLATDSVNGVDLGEALVSMGLARCWR